MRRLHLDRVRRADFDPLYCVITALKYAAYIGGIFGGLLAIFIWWQNWKISRKNKKTLARQDKTKQKTSS